MTNIDNYITDTPDEAVSYPDKKKTRISKKSPNVLAAEVQDRNELTRKKDILITSAILGELESYIGEKLTAVQIRKMEKEKLESLFSIYQAKLGRETTNDLMSSLVEISVKGLSFVVDIDNQEELKNDLVNNKQLRRTLGKQLVGITEKYGDVVAFVKLFSTVGKHVSFHASTNSDSASTNSDFVSTNSDSASTNSDFVSTNSDSASTN